MNESARITARNRANASRSTGPRTRRGKAAVSRNARRHGATGRPPKEDVASWLAIILDRPELKLGSLVPQTDLEFRALSLAEAEARVVMCRDTLDAFEAGEEEPDGSLNDLRNSRELMIELFEEGGNTQKQTRQFYSIMKRIMRVDDQETAFNGRRHKLLKRYLREANAARMKAFNAWLKAISQTQQRGPSRSQEADLPKQSQISA